MSVEPMTPEELDAIEARASRVYPEDSGWNGTEAEDALPVVTEDVPALVAEVRRLRADVVRLQGEVVEARNRAYEERAITDAQTDQRDELIRTLTACRGERDAALAEVERLRAMVDRARELVADARHTDDCAASHHQHCGTECDYDDSTPEECARAYREGCECGLRELCNALGVEVSRG